LKYSEILGVGTASIGSSISAGSTPPVSAGSTPSIPTGSTGRYVFAGRPSGSADRTPVSTDNSKLASTPFEPQKIKEKNVHDEPISVHLYRSMIGYLMCLTATRPDIMFAVCAVARHKVTPKASNLLSVKRIFNDYAGVNRDRNSTTGGC
nr:putative ribonuclease H-like domain-containing protein [Tanacetum cinerariifolium]